MPEERLPQYQRSSESSVLGHSGDFFLGKKKVNRTSCGSSKIARLMVSNIPKNGEKIWNWQGELAKTLNKAFLHPGRFLKLPMFSFLALYFPEDWRGPSGKLR